MTSRSHQQHPPLRRSPTGQPQAPKIFVLHDSDAYFSELRIQMLDQGLPFVSWNIATRFDKFMFDDEPPEGIFYNRVTACGCSMHKASAAMAQTVMGWLKRHRRQVINGEESVKIM